MLKEKNIYQAWEKRFSYPTNPYIRKATQYFRKIKKTHPISERKIKQKIAAAPTIFIGDDALIPQHRVTMISLLSHVKKGKKIVITNRFNQRDQKQMKDFFAFLKRKKIPILTIRGTTQEIDRSFFAFLRKNSRFYDQIICWTGHSRLAAWQASSQWKFPNAFWIYMHSDQLRWSFPNQKAWRQINENSIVNLDYSSLLSLDLFQIWQDGEQKIANVEKIQKGFLFLLRMIAKKMGQKKISYPKKIVHIFQPDAFRYIESLKKNKMLYQFCVQRILQAQSAVMPQNKMVLLSTLQKSHLAEEAAHYLRTQGRNAMAYGHAGVVLEEALAFFASKLLFPDRKIPKFDKRMSDWEKVHFEGYSLGFQLSKAWKKSTSARSYIKKIWKTYPKNDYEAAAIVRLLGKVK